MSDNNDIKDTIREIGESVGAYNERIANAESAVSEVTEAIDEKIEARAKVTDNSLKEIEERLASMEDNQRQRPGVSLPGVEEENRWSWSQALRGICFGEWGDGFEQEVFKETRAKRAVMDSGTTTAGGFLVPDQFIPDLIESLQAESVIFQAGATLLDGLAGGQVQIPKENAVASMTHRTEEGQLTTSDPTLTQVTMDEKHAGTIIYATRNLLRNSSVAVDNMLQRQLLKAAARTIDYYALRGSGSSNQPTGLFNTSGRLVDTNLSTNPAVDATITWQEMIDIRAALEEQNAFETNGKPGVIWSPTVKAALMSQRVSSGRAANDGEGDFVIPPYASDQALANILGMPHWTTSQLQTNASNLGQVAVSADWSKMIIGMWGGMEIEASDQFKFDYNQIAYRLVFNYGVAFTHPEAFYTRGDIG